MGPGFRRDDNLVCGQFETLTRIPNSTWPHAETGVFAARVVRVHSHFDGNGSLCMHGPMGKPPGAAEDRHDLKTPRLMLLMLWCRVYNPDALVRAHRKLRVGAGAYLRSPHARLSFKALVALFLLTPAAVLKGVFRMAAR